MAISFVSCTNDFESANANPNELNEINPEYLFNTSSYYTLNAFCGSMKKVFVGQTIAIIMVELPVDRYNGMEIKVQLMIHIGRMYIIMLFFLFTLYKRKWKMTSNITIVYLLLKYGKIIFSHKQFLFGEVFLKVRHLMPARECLTIRNRIFIMLC